MIKKRKLNLSENCSKDGGEHDWEPIWKWDRNLDDYDFTDMKCEKCGEIK